MEIGQKYGRLTVLAQAACLRPGARRWVCRCDCGTICTVAGSNLRRKTRSCGCLRRSLASERFSTHRMSHTSEYRIWTGMICRCENPHHISFPRYGGRGISVCVRWRQDFAAFYADLGPRPSRRHSLERLRNDGIYEPGNTVWSTPREQTRNKRNNRLLSTGETVTDAAARVGLRRETLRYRLESGWPEERALHSPVTPTACTGDVRRA